MKEYAYTVLLKDDPDIIRQYDAHHAAVWPEVAASLKAVGMRRIKIWRLGRRLFMWVQTPNDFNPADAARRHRAAHPRVREWESMMEHWQEAAPEAGGQDGWAEMDLICELK